MLYPATSEIKNKNNSFLQKEIQIDKAMFECLVMPNYQIAFLAKSEKLLKFKDMLEIFESWH